MNTIILKLTLLSLAIAASTVAGAEELYKWVDENGVVHYGDAIPADAAEKERHILNRHGVTTRVLDRARTSEELAVMAEAERRRQQEARAERVQRERDKVLLDTYLSEDEIAMLRDRRILAIEARVGLTRHYLDNLRIRWDELEQEATNYNFPYQADSELPPLPEELAEDIVFTENAMAEHMTTLRDLREQQAQIRAEFEQDIERFRYLKARQAAELAKAKN